jgi:hypothetical protein
MGVKAIASWLNLNGFTIRGRFFYTGTIHRTLTTETYAGRHWYNQHDSRSRKPRPKSEWVAIEVPAIIPRQQFESAQARLQERRPTVTPPRLSNSEVLLTGLARCESCGASLMLRTGKGGRYRYYACASHRLKGIAACGTPIAIPEAELDRLVLGALTDHLLTPERLPELLRGAYRRRRTASESIQQRRSVLTKQLKEAESKIGRLYAAVEDGTLTNTTLLRSRLEALEKQRDDMRNTPGRGWRRCFRTSAYATGRLRTGSTTSATTAARSVASFITCTIYAASRRYEHQKEKRSDEVLGA